MPRKRNPHPNRRRNKGFTLIEVLVVVAIIALLVSILLPSLARAREQARRAKCLANMSSLGKAVMAFSVGHQGRGQLMGRVDASTAASRYDKLDGSRKFYAYETWNADGTGIQRHKPWPVAYARDLGYTSLKHTLNYFDYEEEGKPYMNEWPNSADPQWFWKRKGKFEVFYCPSDKLMIRDSWSPDHMIGVMSYAVNVDVFGAAVRDGNNPYGEKAFSYGKNGAVERRDQLAGRLDGIIRPSEVAIFTDLGNESVESVVSKRNSNVPGMNEVSDGFFSAGNLITNDTLAVSYGTSYLDGAGRRAVQAFPNARHGSEGGLCVAFADGHAAFVNGAGGFSVISKAAAATNHGWVAAKFAAYAPSGSSILVTKSYINAPRVTPYNPLRRPAVLTE